MRCPARSSPPEPARSRCDWFAGAIIAANNAYNQALERDPDYPEPRVNVAALHHKYGDVEQAVAQYEIVLTKPRLSAALAASVRKNLAQAHLDTGNVPAALRGATPQ